ncbi:MAG: LptA/OstA family protein [Acetobacteraceae bacterium]|nr:LptA/OstA family protein [Acetobacteraceae bacterium]
MIRRLALVLLLPGLALAQSLDFTRGGPVEVTAREGIEWRQAEQAVVAIGDARAVRDGVTLSADRLTARYRPRGGAAAPQPDAQNPVGGSEIWRLEADGNVRIETPAERAEGARAVYDMDQAVMVLSGGALRLTTPDAVLTARDSLEYWPQRRMAVARGDALVVATDGRRIRADTLVGHFLEEGAARAAAPAPAPGGRAGVPGQGSRIERVEAFGAVEIRTAEEVIRGDRGVYSPLTGTARLTGNVRITRGENQLNGAEAIVDLRAGTARLVAAPGERVQGVVLPGSAPPAQQQAPAQRPPAAGAPR